MHPAAASVGDWLDEMRRSLGSGFDALGLGPKESPYRIAGAFHGARLRAYFRAEKASGPVLLIVPAPYKRPYIWDLSPEISVVRRLAGKGIRVYLLEWLAPTEAEDGFGLAEYVRRLPAAARRIIAAETGVRRPLLAGHSIGGTFAAIFAALYPGRVAGLVLVDTPLAFGEHGGPITRALRRIPHARHIRNAVGSPVPGSVIDMLSVIAAPEVFQLQRVADKAASLMDPDAYALHLRMERWSCDELPMPGRLFEETLEQLYREDRFCSRRLRVDGRLADLKTLRMPIIAVVNPLGRIVPPASVVQGLEAAGARRAELLVYPGDCGPMLQHLGPLVAPTAHAQLWPRILGWISEHAQ